MPTGRETLDQVIDKEAEFFQQHGEAPHKMKLPVPHGLRSREVQAAERVGRNDGRVFKDGISVFEREACF